MKHFVIQQVSHATEVKRVPSLESELLFPFTNISLNPSMHSQAQHPHNVVIPQMNEKTFKNTKYPKISENQVNHSFRLQEKNSSYHPKLWTYICKNRYLYVCDGLLTYESILVISCLFASLSHQRFYCKKGPLFLSSKSMSKDEPGFRYICNF